MIYYLKFWEIFLKSKQTKKQFLNIFYKQLKKLWFTDIEYRNAYLVVHWKEKGDYTKLLNIFWVQNIEVVEYSLDYNLDKFYEWNILSLIKNTLDIIVKKYNFDSFRISTKREEKRFPINSMDLQMILWKYISDKYEKQASYKKYDLEIKIRILKNKIWIWTNKDLYKWLWWLPYWIEWKALNLFSWWIDSPVATFLSAKRGIKQDFLFLNIPWSDLLTSQVFEIYSYLKKTYGIEGNFYMLDISSYIKIIKDKIHSWYRQIIFKIFLYKVAEKIASKLKVNSIINWENIWQVSTQTLTNIELLDSVINKLNIRPLLCYDKIDIIEFAEKIWTFSFSSKIKETCSLEEHSDSRIKNKELILWLFEDLNFDINDISNNVILLNKSNDINILKYKLNEVVWKLIDIEKNNKNIILKEWNKYTFTCSSWYKASQKVLETRKQWFETFFM